MLNSAHLVEPVAATSSFLAQVEPPVPAPAVTPVALPTAALAGAPASLAALGELETGTAKLAHELKNPLSVIRSLLQLELRNADHSDKTVRRLEVALAEAERMQTIVRDHLEAGKASHALATASASLAAASAAAAAIATAVPSAPPPRSKLELGELMDDVAHQLAGRAETSGVKLSITGAGGAILAEARQLKEAVLNIALNAFDATPRGGTVDVAYHVGPRGVSITVRDSGIGMSRQVTTKLGTPYFTTRAGGTGLGVVIAKAAIARHRGTLDFRSTPGLGTTAIICLPADCVVH
jgi:signal transduction histidine kinase